MGNFKALFTRRRCFSFSFVLTLVCITLRLSAQHLNNPLQSLHDHKEFIIGIDNRITWINDRFGVIYGLYSGVGYGENLRLKFSISGTPFELGKHNKEEVSSRLSRLLFVSAGQEFDFLTIGNFKVSSYLNAGFGYHFFRYVDSDQNEFSSGREAIWPMELGVHGRYQINPLFAFKTGGGWRFILPNDADDLSGFYIKFTAVVNPKKLKEHFKNRRKKVR